MDSPAKGATDESSHVLENRGVQLLGQIRHGSCRPRAILFKVLSDTIGLESGLLTVCFLHEICALIKDVVILVIISEQRYLNISLVVCLKLFFFTGFTK